MATNQILAFASGATPDVLSQEEYASLGDISTGFPTGILARRKLNKVLKQSSLVSAAVAQIAVDAGVSVSDTMSAAALSIILRNAIRDGSGTVAALELALAGTATAQGTDKVSVVDAGSYFSPGTGATTTTALQMLGALARKKCNPLMSPWFAKFDNSADDTIALNNCLAYATANNLTVEWPAGTAIVSNLLFGSQNTSGQSNSPAGIVGAGVGATRIKAKAGTSGVLLKAWSIAGVLLSGFTLDCNNQASLVAIDTSWKAGVGPSLQCVYSSVWVENYRDTGWLADHNNDCTFSKVNVRNPYTTTQVALRIRGSGGMVSLVDCTWSSGLLDIAAQNVSITTSWGHGIRFAAGATNVVLLSGLYLYASPVTGALIATENMAVGTKIQAVEANGCWFDCTSPYPIFKARVGSSITLNGTTFSPTGATLAVTLLDASCTRDLGNGRVMVHVNGGRAEYNPNGVPPGALVVNFAAPTGFTVVRRSFDRTGVQVNDTGLVIRKTVALGAVTSGTWYSLTAGNELEPGAWVIDVLLTVSGAPFYVGTAALVRTIPTNAASASAVLTQNSLSHANSGAVLSLRAAANTTGAASDFDWSVNAAFGAGASLEVVCTKIS